MSSLKSFSFSAIRIFKFWSILFGSCCQKSQKNHRTLTSDLSVLVTVLDLSYHRSVLKNSIKFNNDDKVNFHRLGSLSIYHVFQYYPAIRSLSLAWLLTFMKVVLLACKPTTRSHVRENPLLAGYFNTAVQKRERKTWGRTKFLINTVMFKWGWWFVILWAPVSNWIRNYIIQGLFNFISIASVSVERWVFVSQKLVGTTPRSQPYPVSALARALL